MAITYRIDEELGVIFTTATGCLTDEELLTHKKKVVYDPQFKPGMVELSDVRGVERMAVTAEGVQRMTMVDAADGTRLENFKLAIVVAEDVVFGMGRMYQTMTSDNFIRVNLFRDMDAARRWLGIDNN